MWGKKEKLKCRETTKPKNPHFFSYPFSISSFHFPVHFLSFSISTLPLSLSSPSPCGCGVWSLAAAWPSGSGCVPDHQLEFQSTYPHHPCVVEWRAELGRQRIGTHWIPERPKRQMVQESTTIEIQVSRDTGREMRETGRQAVTQKILKSKTCWKCW